MPSKSKRKKIVEKKTQKKKRNRLSSAFSKVKVIEKVILAKHLSIALQAGLDIVEALEALREQTSSKALKAILSDVKDKTIQGSSLAESFEK